MSVVELQTVLKDINTYLSNNKPTVKKEKFIEGFIFYEQELDSFSKIPEKVIARNTLHNWLRQCNGKSFKPHKPLIQLHFIHLAAYYEYLIQGGSIESGNSLYLITESPFSGFFKVGIVTTGTLHDRVHDLQTGNPRQLVLLENIQCKDSITTKLMESFMHQSFKKMQAVGEWFKCETEHDLEYVRTLFKMISSGGLTASNLVKKETS